MPMGEPAAHEVLRATNGSVAIPPVVGVLLRDCFVATLLAMTLYVMRLY